MKRFLAHLANTDPLPLFLALLGLAVALYAGAPPPGSGFLAALGG